VQDLIQLIDIVSPFENWLSRQQFCQNAANRPHIDRRSVVRKAKHNLGRAVPPRRDVLGHEALLLRLVKPARESKVAYLELAVRVHEQVAWLEVAVQYVGRVDVLQTAERLVNEGLEVRVRERLARADDGVEVGLHELFVEIHLIEVPIRAEDNVHIIQASDVLVSAEMMQQLDLTQTSLCEYPLCVDVRYFLDRAPFPRAPVLSGYDAAVSALSEFLDELVLRVDNKGRVQSGETVSLHGTVLVEGDKDGGMKQGTNDSSIIYPFKETRDEAPQGIGSDDYRLSIAERYYTVTGRGVPVSTVLVACNLL